MTIAELEARSGMTRANIRFYEAEGFIRPERRENGYRDYSEAELELLRLTPIMLIFRPNVDFSGFGFNFALTVGGIMLMLLLEPLCLHLFGTTPGKRLLGLYVERPDGGRLSYGEAARRTFDVLTYGLGFYVPILSLVLCILSWHKHKEGRPLRWEEGSELRLDKKHLGLLTAGFVALAVFAGFLGFVNEELSQMPKNRGDISAAEFCENYNGLAHMDGYLRSYISLTPGGWERTSMNPTRLEVQGY